MIKAVIDGGPGTGKTSIIKELKKRGYNVAPEAARIVFHRKKYRDNPSMSKARLKEIQKAIWNLSIQEYRSALKTRKNHILFFDRGVFSGLSYIILGKMQIPKTMLEQANLVLYDYVFIPSPLPKRLYINDTIRRESYDKSTQIHKKIIQSYKKFGYKPIVVPFGTVKQRTDFIMKRIRRDLKI
ncbi:MAG: ATP-binding protein [Nanoarchaeota archaeon]